MASPHKILVRTWLPGKGCVHLRSTAMSQAEARDLLDAARDIIGMAQESGRIEEVPLEKGRAFVKARRSPDPDQPNRTAPGFVLVSIPDPEAFLRDAGAREFDELLRFVASQALDAVPPAEQASDLGRRDWKVLDLGGPAAPSKSKARPPEWTRRLLGAMAVSLFLAASFGIFLHLRKTAPKADGAPPARTNLEDVDQERENWELAKQQIQDLLKEDWAVKLLGEITTEQASNHELVNRFTRLFKQPNLQDRLNGDSLKYYDLKHPHEHPFVAFLNRFPKDMPVKFLNETEPSPTEAMNYLRTLGSEMDAFEIHLDLKNIEKLSQNVRRNLDYRIFFDHWMRLTRSDKNINGLWDLGKEDKGREFQWLVPIRDLIKSCYPKS